MIREERDPEFWNALANHPQVRQQLGGDGPLDLSPLLANDLTVALAADDGGFLFVKHEVGRYELHTLFRPEGRGANVLTAFSEAARHLFTRTDALEIVTKTPESNRAAAFMARRAGFRPLFERPGAWSDGSAVTFYTLTLDEWMQRDPTVEGEGHAFHQLLEAAKAASGSALPTHPDDPAHDRAAGSASLMARSGQAAKAAWIYSRWAVLAGYQTIELIEDDPPVIDVRDALVTVRDGALEVLQCR